MFNWGWLAGVLSLNNKNHCVLHELCLRRQRLGGNAVCLPLHLKTPFNGREKAGVPKCAQLEKHSWGRGSWLTFAPKARLRVSTWLQFLFQDSSSQVSLHSWVFPRLDYSFKSACMWLLTIQRQLIIS